MQAEHRLIQRTGLIGLHPVQPGEDHLLEPLRFQITDRELKQPGGDSPPGQLRVLVPSAGQAVRDESSEIFDVPGTGQYPGVLAFQQLPDRGELGVR